MTFAFNLSWWMLVPSLLTLVAILVGVLVWRESSVYEYGPTLLIMWVIMMVLIFLARFLP